MGRTCAEFLLNSVRFAVHRIAVCSFSRCFYSAGAWRRVKESATEELKMLAGTIKHEVKTCVMTANGNSEKTPEGYRRIRGTHRG
jgi:hypothetical protein